MRSGSAASAADGRGRKQTTARRPAPAPTASARPPRSPSCDRDIPSAPDRSSVVPSTAIEPSSSAGHHRHGVAGEPSAARRGSRSAPAIGRASPSARSSRSRARRRSAAGRSSAIRYTDPSRRTGLAPTVRSGAVASSSRSSTSVDAAYEVMRPARSTCRRTPIAPPAAGDARAGQERQVEAHVLAASVEVQPLGP